MPTARFSLDERRALVADWRRSGQSQSRFAFDHGVPQSSFSKWVARYTPAVMARPTFATVEVVDETPPPNLLVHLAADLLGCIVKAMRKEQRAGSWLQADDTGLPVLDGTKGQTGNGRL